MTKHLCLRISYLIMSSSADIIALKWCLYLEIAQQQKRNHAQIKFYYQFNEETFWINESAVKNVNAIFLTVWINVLFHLLYKPWLMSFFGAIQSTFQSKSSSTLASKLQKVKWIMQRGEFQICFIMISYHFNIAGTLPLCRCNLNIISLHPVLSMDDQSLHILTHISILKHDLRK